MRSLYIFKVVGFFLRSLIIVGRLGVLSLPGSATDAVPKNGLIRDQDPTLAFIHRIWFVFFLKFDDEIQILLGSIIDGDVMRQKLTAPLKLAIEATDWLLHPFDGLLIGPFGGCHWGEDK